MGLIKDEMGVFLFMIIGFVRSNKWVILSGVIGLHERVYEWCWICIE